MVAPIAHPDAPINQAAKDLTSMQIEFAQQLILQHKITNPALAAAVLTNLALNLHGIRPK